MASTPPDERFVVLVGASAGGVDVLRRLVSDLPAEFPAPIVVAQHVGFDRSSRLADILAPASPLPVRTIEGRTPLESGVVHVVGHHRHATITDHEISLEDAAPTASAPSIDRLLASASESIGDRLVAVILSGMGADGAAGARDVRARGGTVVIQDPSTAAFPSMPQSLPPALVDFVAPPDELASLIAELVNGALTPPTPQEDRLLRTFLEQVRETTGMDFGAYKLPTIRRRLQRRVVATNAGTLRAYVRFAQRNPEEYARLASSFLIKVTEFFRDPELFDHLRETLLPRLIEDARAREGELRIWSAGCATGEEAYSLAMLVAEALGDEQDGMSVRIFATDLDEDAVAYARRGIYPISALAGLPPELVRRHFIVTGGEAEVSKRVRGMVVFGQHDLGQRAPFPRIDLALCRNVLIYFTTELQKRALHLFAFSLREGGYLVLGKSESTTPLAEHFVLEQPRLKVYRRAGERVLVPTPRIREATPVGPAMRPPRRGPAWTPSSALAARDRPTLPDRPDQLLLRLPVGVVVVDEAYDIVTINPAARRILGIHGAAIGSDVIHLARRIPSPEVRQRLDDALRGRSSEISVRLTPGSDPAAEDDRVIALTFTPLRPTDDASVTRVLVTLRDVSQASNELRDAQGDLGRVSEENLRTRGRLEGALRSNTELLEANEDLANANAVLRTANEELLVTTEEIQAATEEVETLNEELQATNEELETLNEELQATVEELNTTNDDLEARSVELEELAASLQEQRTQSDLERAKLSLILDEMGDALIAIDARGTVVAPNRAYLAAFGDPDLVWVPEDEVGRPLPRDQWPQARAARGEAFRMEFSVRGRDGSRRWYEATNRGGPAGPDWIAVIVFRDITDRSLRALQDRFIAAAGHELRTPVAALHGFLQLIAREAADGPPALVDWVAQATAHSRALGDLVARLFDVSRIHQGSLMLDLTPVDLSTIVDEAVATVRTLHPGSTVELAAGARLKVRGDAVRLRQVVLNLLVNAATHAGPGPIDVRLEAARSVVVLEVADRGPGLPPAVRARLFDAFVTDPTSSAGLGLGLFLAREIVEAHGGTIDLEDREGGGTCVRIELPRLRERTGSGVASPRARSRPTRSTS